MMRRIQHLRLRKTLLALALVTTGGGALALGADTQRRIVFLALGAPQILAVSIQGGRFSVEETRRRYAEGVFQRLDKDHDGMLSPDEAAAIPRSGRLQAREATLGSDWRLLDRSPPDGAISLDELAAHLDAVSGPAVAITRQPPRLSQSVRLYDELDLNHDGRIAADEVEQGFEVLRASDFDDDETLSVAELQPFPRSVVEARRQRQSEEEPSPLLMLSSDSETMQAAVRCLAQYGDGMQIPLDRLPGLPPPLLRRFDRDGNGRWDRAEVLLFLEQAPPVHTLTVSLSPPQVSVDAERSRRGQRPVLQLAGVPVTFLAKDRTNQLSDSTRLYKIRFLTSDRDKNGYLDEAEFGGLQAGSAPFAAVDLDGNGQVTSEEIEQYFSLDGLYQQSRFVITLSNETKTLFDILDAHGMEVGGKEFGDKRLTPREFREGRERLLAFDRDHDSALVRNEFLNEFSVTFSQPELLDETPLQEMPGNMARPPSVVEKSSGPLWFRRMDRNLDGEISWREFLGPREDFDLLDTNHDGSLDEREAEIAQRLKIGEN